MTGHDRVTHSEAETAALARTLAATLTGGETILLAGDLGAGKTAFVRGLAEGLGVDPEEVSSPTFTLVQRYDGRLVLWHADLYRLQPGAEVRELGLDELALAGGVVAVEWSDRCTEAPPDAIQVRIEDLGDDRRRVIVTDERVGASDAGGYSTR